VRTKAALSDERFGPVDSQDAIAASPQDDIQLANEKQIDLDRADRSNSWT